MNVYKTYLLFILTEETKRKQWKRRTFYQLFSARAASPPSAFHSVAAAVSAPLCDETAVCNTRMHNCHSDASTLTINRPQSTNALLLLPLIVLLFQYPRWRKRSLSSAGPLPFNLLLGQTSFQTSFSCASTSLTEDIEELCWSWTRLTIIQTQVNIKRISVASFDYSF